MDHTDPFAAWLAQRYRPSTARATASAVRKARTAYLDGDPLPERYGEALRRYAGFLTDAGVREPFDQAVAEHFEPVHGRPDRRPKRPREAYDTEDWRTLVGALREPECREDCVLLVMAATGHRVGDVLRLTRPRLDEGLRTGVLRIERKGGQDDAFPVRGAEEPWQQLSGRWPVKFQNVAQLVCPDGDPETGSGAYQRVRKRLVTLHEDLGLRGRPHLHRLRRTVAVRAIAATKDIHRVQQFLGHRNLSTTSRYLTDPRLDDVAELQEAIRVV